MNFLIQLIMKMQIWILVVQQEDKAELIMLFGPMTRFRQNINILAQVQQEVIPQLISALLLLNIIQKKKKLILQVIAP